MNTLKKVLRELELVISGIIVIVSTILLLGLLYWSMY